MEGSSALGIIGSLSGDEEGAWQVIEEVLSRWTCGANGRYIDVNDVGNQSSSLWDRHYAENQCYIEITKKEFFLRGFSGRRQRRVASEI